MRGLFVEIKGFEGNSVEKSLRLAVLDQPSLMQVDTCLFESFFSKTTSYLR